MVHAGDVGFSAAASFDVATLDPDVVARRTLEFLDHNSWSREQLLTYQKVRLKKTLQHAVSASAFYRKQIGDLVARNAPLEALPTMNKAILMAEFDRIVTDPRLNRATVEQHIESDSAGLLLLDEYRVGATGGSSGQRGVFVYDQAGWELAFANARRFQRMLGMPPDARALGIGAPSPVHLTYRFNAEHRVGRPDAPRLSVTTPMPEVVTALNAYQPELISTYPSFIRQLAEEQRAGRLRISPRAMRSVAEVLSPDVKDLVWNTWEIRVTNNYAATEAGIIGMECMELSGIHLAEDLVIVEVVDEANRPVPPGVQGAKVLVTTMFNRVLPVVRYELSDLVTMVPGHCPCGSPFRRIEDIQGRSEEMLQVWTSSGEQVNVHAARLWFHLVRVAGIRQYQFVQLPTGIRVLLAVYSDCDRAEVRKAGEQIVRTALSDLGAKTAHVEIQIVDKVDRIGSGAKLKSVVAAQT
jgi:phenylacetate-CoA ligase